MKCHNFHANFMQTCKLYSHKCKLYAKMQTLNTKNANFMQKCKLFAQKKATFVHKKCKLYAKMQTLCTKNANFMHKICKLYAKC